MSRDSSRLTSGRSSTLRTTLNIAALAPIPSARVTMTVSDNPFTRVRDRNANFKSLKKLIGILFQVDGELATTWTSQCTGTCGAQTGRASATYEPMINVKFGNLYAI